MSIISQAIPDGARSRVTGQALIAANFTNRTSNLPQTIVLFGEGNTANQATMTTDPFDFTNANEVGAKYGYGSPLHQMARILRPLGGNILGGVQTKILPQLSDGGATPTVITKGVTVASTVTETATHSLIINGRGNIDGQKYSYQVVKGQNEAAVVQTIIDTINAALYAPVTAADATGDIAITTKWGGSTSAELNITFDTGGKSAGVVYAEVSKVDGTGVVDITASLALIQNVWETLLINPYGSSEFDELEAFNGDPANKTGRYAPEVTKPLLAFFGTTASTKAAVVAITDVEARKSQVTNVHCPAPNSKGFSWEAAANMVATYANTANESPHLGNGGVQYPDMPIPADGDIGEFADYLDRDYLVKRGSSTVSLSAGKYTVEDFVTTYHPDGELFPKYSKVRDLINLWNQLYLWRIIMVSDIQDKAIVGNDSAVIVRGTIAPKQVKQLAFSYFANLAEKALINDVQFSKDSVIVGVGAVNPSRLDIQFKTKLTSTADIVSTDIFFDFTFNL